MSRAKKYNSYNEFDNLLEGGDADAAPVEGEAAKPEDQKSQAKSSGSKKSKSSKKSEAVAPVEEKKNNVFDDDPYATPIREPCCCCDCVCANEFTKESSCCGCFPIKCGAVTIGIITVLVTAILFVWYFFLFMNEYIHWWYVLICLFLLCPILVGSAFVICWFTLDTSTTRTMLYTSQILALVSVFLVASWNLIYFVFIYKKDKFYAGMGDIPSNVYTQQNKKNFIFTMLGESVFMFCMFGYFLCVTAAYSEDMHGPAKEEEEVAADVKSNKSKGSSKSKASAKKSEKPQSDKPAEGAGDAPAE